MEYNWLKAQIIAFVTELVCFLNVCQEVGKNEKMANLENRYVCYVMRLPERGWKIHSCLA